MKLSDTFKVTTPGEFEIVMARDFDAPPDMIFDALTKPELVRRWLLGPDGWIMSVCEIDLKVGGAWRYGWRSLPIIATVADPRTERSDHSRFRATRRLP